MTSTDVVVRLELPDDVAFQLAQFCKRSTFDTFFALTEAHLPTNERQARAYQMIAGIEAMRDALADAGVSPR